MALDSPRGSRKEHRGGVGGGVALFLILNLAECVCPQQASAGPESSSEGPE